MILPSLSPRLTPPPFAGGDRAGLRLSGRLQIKALDAAQAIDYESHVSDLLESRGRLKIAIVGFGNYGQFLAKTFARQGHSLLAHSRSDHSEAARSLGAAFFQDPNDLCEEHPEVVLLCTSILSSTDVLRSFPLQRLRRSTLFVDVLSVKQFAKDLLLQHLPQDFDILCTHPMFGPQSGKHSWADLPFVYEKVRIGESEAAVDRCQRFLDIFGREGCRMVEMSCADHDKNTAEIQFLTHTVGRILAKLDLKSTPINTKGYEALLNLMENIGSDSFELYTGLFMYNDNSMELLERLNLAFDSLEKELFRHLHDISRKLMFKSEDEEMNS